ncbi:MAG: diguanylate cyclase [Thermoleophilaceae bacterium]
MLPAGTMATVIARMAGALRQNRRLLLTTRRQASTDALTGLGNRRRLVEDLEIELRRATAARPTVLALFDLDGFKAYNDAFGHPAGDALLVRLGEKLSCRLADVGAGYRMGGDEFCVLVQASGSEAEDAIAAAGEALSDRGVGFQVAPSRGTVTLPREANHGAMALQIADRRMYDDKARRRANNVTSPVEQTRDVLMRILSERQPDLGSHVDDIARLATGTARRMGLGEEAVAEVGQAAQLHDIGKIAVPDTLLDKRGPLDEAEWRFMRQHTVLGEHILEAAPSLAGVAHIVRSTHEAWDGSGYPDGLAGEEIPLGARIVAACDAYDAMTTDRAYRGALTFEAATGEMRRGAETQFDPGVIAALLEELETSRPQSLLAVAG